MALPVIETQHLNKTQASTSANNATLNSFIKAKAPAISPEACEDDDEQINDDSIAARSKKRYLILIGNKGAKSANTVAKTAKRCS